MSSVIWNGEYKNLYSIQINTKKKKKKKKNKKKRKKKKKG